MDIKLSKILFNDFYVASRLVAKDLILKGSFILYNPYIKSPVEIYNIISQRNRVRKRN